MNIGLSRLVDPCIFCEIGETNLHACDMLIFLLILFLFYFLYFSLHVHKEVELSRSMIYFNVPSFCYDPGSPQEAIMYAICTFSLM